MCLVKVDHTVEEWNCILDTGSTKSQKCEKVRYAWEVVRFEDRCTEHTCESGGRYHHSLVVAFKLVHASVPLEYF